MNFICLLFFGQLTFSLSCHVISSHQACSLLVENLLSYLLSIFKSTVVPIVLQDTQKSKEWFRVLETSDKIILKHE